MRKAVLSKDYQFPSGKYKKYRLFRCYGAEKFEDFCKSNLAGEIDMESIWNDFFRNHVSNGKTDFVLEAAYTKDHNCHVIRFCITYVFPNVLCMDRGDCESIVIEWK